MAGVQECKTKKGILNQIKLYSSEWAFERALSDECLLSLSAVIRVCLMVVVAEFYGLLFLPWFGLQLPFLRFKSERILPEWKISVPPLHNCRKNEEKSTVSQALDKVLTVFYYSFLSN